MGKPNPLWLKLILFFSSFSPLWLIILISVLLNDNYSKFTKLLNYDPNTIIFVSGYIIILIVIPLLFLSIFIYAVKKGSPAEPKTIMKRQNMTGEYALYFLAYILPFLLNDFNNTQHVVSLIILFATYAILMLRSNSIHVNPILNLWGYKIYKITDQNKDEVWLLSKNRVIIDNEIKVHELDEDVYITP